MPVKQPFETVVAQHGPTVWRVCRAMVGAVDADDAWSETFLAALRAYPDLPEDANVEAWLVTIAQRKAIDQTRRARRQPTPVADVPHPGRDDDHPDLDLAPALAALPERQRRAVIAHHVAGLPYREVATIIGGSVDAARRAASDGIANLRKKQGILPPPPPPPPARGAETPTAPRSKTPPARGAKTPTPDKTRQGTDQ